MLDQRIHIEYSKAILTNKLSKRYILLYEVIKKGIVDLDFPEGETMPSTRKLAELLKLSRSTVIRAYELLSLEGYLQSTIGSGHRILGAMGSNTEVDQTFSNADLYPDLSEAGHSFLENVGLMNTTEEKSIAFRPGLPPLDIFPVNKWKSLTNLYWRQIRSSELNYSPSAGLQNLRKNLASYLALSRGLKCDPDQIFIVSGSLQSLFLTSSSLINPGDHVVLENPTFPNVHSIFKSLRSHLHPLDVDCDGARIDQLPHGEQVKLIHLTPSCHYPLGAELSLERRKYFVKWAKENKAIIIENDYENEVNRHSKSLPTIYSLDRDQRTVYMGTFNRLVHPSIRIGYMVAPPYLIQPLEAFMKHSHRFVAPSLQLVFNQFIEKKFFYSHIKEVREVLSIRQKIFQQHFENLMGDIIKLQMIPHSMHALAFPKFEVSDSRLVEALQKAHISTHSLSKCYVNGTRRAGLVLGYSSVRPPMMKSKLNQMNEIIRHSLQDK
jgi:GntR family transcriptional regulator/MocR family aminotransferase